MANIRERTVVRSGRQNTHWLLYVVAGLLLAGSVAFGVIYFQKYQQLNSMSAAEFEQRENDRIISKIAKLYTLPAEEQPEIAIVKDKEALRQNPFFEQAENGDFVVIFRDAKLALLYRPGEDRLVKVGPLNVQDTTNIGVIGQEADRRAVTEKLAKNQLVATDKGVAKGATTGILVVDLAGDKEQEAAKLAEIVGGKVGALPAGEEKPSDVDLLIIAGSGS